MREDRVSENYQKKKEKKHKKGTYIFKGASSDDKKKNKIQKRGPKETCKSLKTNYPTTSHHVLQWCLHETHSTLRRFYHGPACRPNSHPSLSTIQHLCVSSIVTRHNSLPFCNVMHVSRSRQYFTSIMAAINACYIYIAGVYNFS